MPSLSKTSLSMARIATVAVAPNISAMFAMLDPTMLPMIKSVVPESAAATDDANSGKDVPAATTVRPITKSETFSIFAMRAIFSIRKSLDFTKKNNEITKIINSV